MIIVLQNIFAKLLFVDLTSSSDSKIVEYYVKVLWQYHKLRNISIQEVREGSLFNNLWATTCSTGTMLVYDRKGLYHIWIKRFEMVLYPLSLVIRFYNLIKHLCNCKVYLGLNHRGLQFNFRCVHFLFVILELLSFKHFFSQIFASNRQNYSKELTVGDLSLIHISEPTRPY